MNEKFVVLMDKIDKLEESSNSMKQELFIYRNENKKNTENSNDEPEPSKVEVKSQPKVRKASKNEKLRNLSKEPSAQKPHMKDPKTLFVGDSVSDVADFNALEEATETKIVHVKAYTAVFDEISNEAKISARFPQQNFTDVIPAALEKEEFKNVIVQSGSVDITNFQTKKEAEKHFDYFHQQSVISAENLFSACENGIRSNSNIEKVVIMKQIPRYDRADMDPLSIKQALSQIYNNTLTDLWLKSPLKHKLFVGNHDLECTGGIRQSRYRNVHTGDFDGIHLFGSSGGKFFTKSTLNILKQAGLIIYDYEQLNCAQAQYQSSRRGFKKTGTWPLDKDVRKHSYRQKVYRDTYSIPLKNRFSKLSQEDQGNY